MPLIDSLDLGSLAAGQAQKTPRGLLVASISLSDGRPAAFQLTEKDAPLYCPWGASSFQEGSRLNVDLDLAEHAPLCGKLAAIDQWAQQAGEALGFTGTYKPMVTCKSPYPPKLRCKLSTVGTNTTKFWDPEGAQHTSADAQSAATVPQLKGARVVPVVRFSKIWSSNNMFGLTPELQHLVVYAPVADECPALA